MEKELIGQYFFTGIEAEFGNTAWNEPCDKQIGEVIYYDDSESDRIMARTMFCVHVFNDGSVVTGKYTRQPDEVIDQEAMKAHAALDAAGLKVKV